MSVPDSSFQDSESGIEADTSASLENQYPPPRRPWEFFVSDPQTLSILFSLFNTILLRYSVAVVVVALFNVFKRPKAA
jgi:hypothetical protein